MQLKSIVLLTALAAAVAARPHHKKRACTTDVPAPPVETTTSTPVPDVPTTTPEPAPPVETAPAEPAPPVEEPAPPVETTPTEPEPAPPVEAPAPEPTPEPAPEPEPAPVPEPEPAPAPAPACAKMDGDFCIEGFGDRTAPSGEGISYKGNVGNPYNSNIILVDAAKADLYKYTVKFVGSDHMGGDYKVLLWNKIGPDGGLNGFFNPNRAVEFMLAKGGEQFVAFDENTNGGWAAAQGDIPLTNYGAYGSNWGEFDFGSSINNGWSGFDVSQIVPQNAGMPVQGMRICDITSGSQGVCSTITTNSGRVDNAYTVAETDIGGIGGNLQAGKVRLEAVIEFND